MFEILMPKPDYAVLLWERPASCGIDLVAIGLAVYGPAHESFEVLTFGLCVTPVALTVTIRHHLTSTMSRTDPAVRPMAQIDVGLACAAAFGSAGDLGFSLVKT